MRVAMLVVALAVVSSAILVMAASEILWSTASAAPPPVGGLNQRIQVTQAAVPANTTYEIQASCGPKELLTGGGYQLGSIGLDDKVYVNAPLDETTWLVEVVNNTAFEIDVWAFAVCLSRGSGG